MNKCIRYDQCYSAEHSVFHRFNSEVLTEGYVDESGVGHCIAPLLYEAGWISFEVSTDGVNFDRSGRWLSGELQKSQCTEGKAMKVFLLCMLLIHQLKLFQII